MSSHHSLITDQMSDKSVRSHFDVKIKRWLIHLLTDSVSAKKGKSSEFNPRNDVKSSPAPKVGDLARGLNSLPIAAYSESSFNSIINFIPDLALVHAICCCCCPAHSTFGSQWNLVIY